MKRIRKKFLVIFSISLIVIILLGAVLAYIPGRMTEGHTNDIVEMYFDDMNYSKEQFESTWASKVEEDEILAYDGHKIPIYYYKSENSYDNKTIVLVHWHESNHKAMYPIADFFLEQNFNVVLYDAPAHGSNTAKRVGFGYYEKDDLKSVITYIKGKMSKENIIGALGQSMGGTTVAYYSGTDHAKQNLDFAIIDSAYTSMDAIIATEIDKNFLPFPTKLIIRLGSISNKFMYSFSYEDVNAVKSISTSKIPMLIMHSKADKKCPFFMGKELFDAIPHKNKNFIIFDNSSHLEAFWDENQKYKSAISEFIEDYSLSVK
jgi:fermentation-respiration switch protein FrsA (DUF1100 family)